MAGLTWRRELGERLAHAWCRAELGGGQVVVVVGDPGMGKTTMLSWLAEHIGPAARTVTCRSGDAAPALSTAVDVAAGWPQPIRARMSAGDLDTMHAADVLCEGFESAHGAALLVDDVHAADPASRTALNLALRRAVMSGVLVVVTGRRVPSVHAFAEGFAVEELGGLDPADAASVLESAGVEPIAPVVAARLIDLAAGNPLALAQLPHALSPEQLAGRQPLPDEIPLLGDLAAAFTRYLPPPGSRARELLDRIALSADDSWSCIESSALIDPGTALEELENLGLAELSNGRLTLHHPLLRSAVIGSMTEHRRRQLHLEFADSAALSAEVKLAHRAQGTVGPDEALAESLVHAAARMRAGRGIESAARMLDQAVQMTGSDARRGRLLLETAELLGAAGDAQAARYRLEAVLAEERWADLHVAATLTLATLEAVDGAPAAAQQRLMECVAVAAPDQVGVVEARMAIPLGMLGMVQQIIESAEAAVAHTRPGSVEADVARVVLAHAASARDEGRADEFVDSLEPLDLVAAIRHDPLVGLHVGRAMAIAERYAEATTALTRLIGTLRAEGARASLAMAYGALGENHIRASRFDDALVCLDEAVALCMGTGQRAFAPFWLGLRARVAAVRGDDQAAQADLDLGFTISDRQSTFGARYFLLANAGLTALTERRDDDVIATLGECWAFEQAGGLLAPQVARWHVDLVEVYSRQGRRDDAVPLVEHLETVAAASGASRWTRGTARRARALLCADSEPERAGCLLDEAVSIFDPEIDAFDRSRALMDKARVCADPVARDRSRTEALYGFRRIGASPWAARVTADDRAPLDELTDAERRILDEVAQGLTNQQIAKRLHLSAKTVANHLYRAYPKLGVSSRTEAARHMLLRDGRADQLRSSAR